MIDMDDVAALPHGEGKALALTFLKSVDVNIRGNMLDWSVSALNLGVRIQNCLESEGIVTIGNLIARSEDSLICIRNFGEFSLIKLKSTLKKHGLELGS